MDYCINVKCQKRENSEGLEVCASCGTPLLIRGKYRLKKPIIAFHVYRHTEVFEVIDTKTSEVRILKVLHKADLKLQELIERESEALSHLHHPGLPYCGADDFFEQEVGEDSYSCLLMNKVPGETLEGWIKTNGRASEEQAKDWLKQLVEILNYLHLQGLIHRDIKPANIILQPDGKLVLIDLGSIRDSRTDTYWLKVSRPVDPSSIPRQDIGTTIMVSIGYCPEEQYHGRVVLQSDFFALGRTMVHILTGQHPSYLVEDGDIYTLKWRGESSEISEEFAELIEHLMARRYQDRPIHTQALLEVLEDLGKDKLLWVENISGNQKKLRSISLKWKIIITILLISIVILLGKKFGSWYFYQLGIEHVKNGELLPAQLDYEKALWFDPTDANIKLGIGQVCTLNKNYVCAEAAYKSVLDSEPKNWLAHYSLGRMYDDNEDYQKGIKEYDLAIKYGKDLAIEAIVNLSRLYLISKEYDKAEAMLNKGLQILNRKKTSHEVSKALVLSTLYKDLGWLYLDTGRNGEPALLKSLSLSVGNAATYCLLGRSLDARGLQRESAFYWQMCFEIVSDLPEVRKWRNDKLRKLLQ